MAGEERTIQLSTREFLGDRLRPYEPVVDRGQSLGSQLVGGWISGGLFHRARPLIHGPGEIEILREVGRGALGEVLEVRMPDRHDRRLALKLPLPPFDHTASGIRNEIEKLSRLEHPNLPRIHAHGSLDVGDLHGVPWYVTDLMEPIDRALPAFGQGRPVEPLAVVKVFHALARTLAYFANEGIVHNDVKPENLLFLAGRPILVDWGTARSTSEINELEQNRLAGRLFGTPRWLPPEICDVVGEGEDAWIMLYPDRISQKTDVYGLGLVALRLLSGRDLFEEPLGADVVQLFYRFHHLLRQENLLARYVEQSRRVLERNYLGTDPICESRIRSQDIQRLYQRFDSPPTTTGLPRPTARRKRLFGAPEETTSRARNRFTGVEARKTFVDDFLRFVGYCLAPYEERIKAPALLAKIEALWPGVGSSFVGHADSR